MRVAFSRKVALILFAGCAAAQQPSASRESTGTVAGHVYCVDTNLPARFASVSLEPVDIGPEQPMNGRPVTPSVRVVNTRLDGSFTVSKIKPGTYYVVVRKPGYPSPILDFTRAELEKPTATLAQRIARTVPMVTVGAGQTAPVEVRIEHGAAISGRVLFDDGSPAADVMVSVLRRREEGVWDSVQRTGFTIGMPFIKTDDQGRFRVIDLPTGEFLLRVEFQLNESMTASMFNTGGAWSSSGGVERLSVYAPNVFREEQAARFKLARGEERSSEDIVVPLSKLHTVSGSILNHSGASVNAGMVMLYAEQEKMPLVQTSVGENGEFHLSFVPEGIYRLEAFGVDAVSIEVPAAQAKATGVAAEQKVVKTYGWQRQPVVVRNDITGLVVTVPEPTGKFAAAR